MTKQELFSKAVAYAAEKHAGQTRKDDTPYIWHPLKVAELLKDAGYDLSYQMAGILHDTLEDTSATEEEIRVFGEDVLEAVRLVTRPEGMDEEVYVARILENPMAAAVKNADKIHNMRDLVHCGNIEWAKKYYAKVKKYYGGKFSKALDETLSETGSCLTYFKKTDRPLQYSKEKMMLYSEAAILRYNEVKKYYMENTSHPDFDNPTIQYWYEELVKYYFCFTEGSSYWTLGRGGWLPSKTSPFWEDEYGTYLRRCTREDVDKHIEEMKENGLFYDFVDLEKLGPHITSRG